MAHQIPELADAAGLRWVDVPPGKSEGPHTLYTRDRDEYPLPLALLDAWRTVAIIPELDDNKITDSTTTTALVDAHAKPRYVSPWGPHQVNVLAMATRRIDAAAAKTLAVVYDLFNTFVAGFTLVREQAGSTKTAVNSGAIGTGKFHNDKRLVYILQVLAARCVGIEELYLFDYPQPQADASQKLLQRIDAELQLHPPSLILDLLNPIPAML